MAALLVVHFHRIRDSYEVPLRCHVRVLCVWCEGVSEAAVEGAMRVQCETTAPA